MLKNNMKANELRIGNLVYAFKTTWHVDSTCFSNVELMETYKPIPITEEWLIKFGFVWNGWDRWEHGDISFMSVKYPHIKYIHQLQNLYFALTGEELTVNQEL